MKTGVPQGSILGPMLYNINTADIPKMNNSKIAQYADDTVLYTHSKISTALTKKLPADLDIFKAWAREWKIKINEDKSIAVHFNKKTRQKPPPAININNREIAWRTEAKYLGIILDNNMTFSKHIAETKKKDQTTKWTTLPTPKQKQ